MILKVSNSKAFTLIETIITVSLILFVITLVASSLFLSGKTTTSTNVKNFEEIEKMRVFSQMQKQLACLYFSKGINFCLWADEEVLSGGQSSLIYFLTTMPTKSRGFVLVAYKIVKDKDKKNYLGYKEFPYPAGRLPDKNEGEKFNNAGWTALSYLFEKIQIEYYKNKEDKYPLMRWDGETPPEKIQVILAYRQDKELKKFSFSAFPAISQNKQQEGKIP